MAVPKIFKINRKTFFNPRAWFSFDSFKEESKAVWSIVGDLFAIPSSDRQETFEEALTRLKILDEDLDKTMRSYWFFTIIFLLLGTGSLAYAFYLLFHHHHFWAWILGLSIAALFYANAFRYHFWIFQIKHRKLGCTFAEWRHGKIDLEK